MRLVYHVTEFERNGGILPLGLFTNKKEAAGTIRERFESITDEAELYNTIWRLDAYRREVSGQPVYSEEWSRSIAFREASGSSRLTHDTIKPSSPLGFRIGYY